MSSDHVIPTEPIEQESRPTKTGIKQEIISVDGSAGDYVAPVCVLPYFSLFRVSVPGSFTRKL